MDEHKIIQLIERPFKDAFVIVDFEITKEGTNIHIYCTPIYFWALCEERDGGDCWQSIVPVVESEVTYLQTFDDSLNVLDKIDISNGIPTEEELKEKYKSEIERELKELRGKK